MISLPAMCCLARGRTWVYSLTFLFIKGFFVLSVEEIYGPKMYKFISSTHTTLYLLGLILKRSTILVTMILRFHRSPTFYLSMLSMFFAASPIARL